MNWTTQLARIRRYLRDPDGNIWSDAFLLRLFNAEQQKLFTEIGSVEDVQVVKLPPQFYGSHSQDWEWTFSDNSSGEVYLFTEYYDKEDLAFTHSWEPQTLEGESGTSDTGYRYTHPWEAYAVGDCNQQTPIPAPARWHEMMFAAWDRKPLIPASKEEIAARDMSWKTRSGQPFAYFREDAESNRLFLYPRLSSVTWQDTTSSEGDPDTAEYATSGIDVDNNLTLVFKKRPDDIAAGSDESDFAEFIQKYLEYGVISKAYAANTDGRIESLATYWGYRRDVGIKALTLYFGKRISGRTLRMKTRGVPARKAYRHPRLPDEYPAI